MTVKVPEDVSVFLMEHVLDKVFRGAALDNVEITQMDELFKQEGFRNQFISLLTDHKAKVVIAFILLNS